MRDVLNRYKPVAPLGVHFLLAAAMWTVVGTGLAAVGTYWILKHHQAFAVAFIAGGILAGLAKAHYVLDKAARRISERILVRGDERCLGGFLSWRSWGLVLFMMLLGRLLRASPISATIIGVLYLAIGTSLLTASRIFWQKFGAS